MGWICKTKSDRILSVCKTDGQQSLEFHLDEVDLQFDKVAELSEWTGPELFENYRTVLSNNVLSA